MLPQLYYFYPAHGTGWLCKGTGWLKTLLATSPSGAGLHEYLNFLFVDWATVRNCVRLNWTIWGSLALLVLFLLHSFFPNLLISFKMKICGLFFNFSSSSFPSHCFFFFFFLLKLWLDLSQIISVSSKLHFWWTGHSKALFNSTQWE